MSEGNKSKVEILKNEDSIIHGQTNPSFHDTPEDARNYKSLQIKPQGAIKKPLFVLKESILTKKAEEIRTDKAAFKVTMNNTKGSNNFLVLGNDKKNEVLDKNSSSNLTKVEDPHTDFVFGQNIFARVINSDGPQESSKNAQEFKDFSGDIMKVKDNEEVGTDALRKNAEVAIQKNTTQYLEEAEVITGEEDERSILKMSCKVFLFSNDRQEWVEKGFCFVHVNENTSSLTHKSRLVARSKGGLKVIINTFIWAEMVLIRASERSMRITAQGEEGVKSYLLSMLNSTDADILYSELLRIKMAISKNNSGKTNRKRDFSSSDNDDSFESKKRILSDDE